MDGGQDRQGRAGVLQQGSHARSAQQKFLPHSVTHARTTVNLVIGLPDCVARVAGAGIKPRADRREPGVMDAKIGRARVAGDGTRAGVFGLVGLTRRRDRVFVFRRPLRGLCRFVNAHDPGLPSVAQGFIPTPATRAIKLIPGTWLFEASL